MRKVLLGSAIFLLNLFFLGFVYAQSNSAPIAPLSIEKLHSGEQTLIVGDSTKNLLPRRYLHNNVSKLLYEEIFKEVAKRAGIKKVKFIKLSMDVGVRFAALTNGKVDLLLLVWNRASLGNKFLSTRPYFVKDGISFIYLKDNTSFQKINDIKNHTVGVLRGGYTHTEWLPTQHASPKLIKTYKTEKEMLAALQQKEIDVAILPYLAALHVENNQWRVTLIQPMESVFLLRKQDIALVELLNKALQSMQDDGSLQQIEEVYLQRSVRSDK